ncbi:MAG: EamA family transporter [Clostridia bacterium]|nr:EamA family transporter [Clostridia bacterium]
MGYIFLSIALLTNNIKGYCGKQMSRYSAKLNDTLLICFFRMLMCIGTSAIILAVTGGFFGLEITPKLIGYAAFSGISTAILVAAWLFAANSSGYMMLEVFQMLGVGVTILMSFVIYKEEITVRDVIGFCVLVFAAYLMHAGTKIKPTLKTLAVVILCGLANGMTDFSQKAFIYSGLDTTTAQFQLCSYVFAAVTLIVLYTAMTAGKKTEEKNGATVILKKTWYFVLIMAVCLYANSYFKTEAANYLSAAKLYTLSQGGTMAIGTLMSAFLFKEKLTLKSGISIAITFLGLLIINL